MDLWGSQMIIPTLRLYKIWCTDRSLTLKSKVALWYKFDHFRTSYLVNISNHKECFLSHSFQTMPTALLVGPYSQTPKAQCVCICGSLIPEDLRHCILSCRSHNDPRAKLLAGILFGINSNQELIKLRYCYLILVRLYHIRCDYTGSLAWPHCKSQLHRKGLAKWPYLLPNPKSQKKQALQV